MKYIRTIYVLLFVGLMLLWLLTGNLFQTPLQFFPFRSAMINFTGVLAMGAMSVGMMLALRPFRMEPFLGGLDKSYRLHKWLGVTALVISIIHWLWVEVPRWLVGWGMLVKPPKGPKPPQSWLVEWFNLQHGFAEQVGEWAFYAAVVLILLALIRYFPYRYFFRTHRLLALVYLVLVYHSIVLMKPAQWPTALGMVMALLMLGGSIAAVVSLVGGIGRRMRAVGVVDALEYFRDNHVLQVVIQLRDRWMPHRAGQFAFVTFDEKEGAHPFTLSSCWDHRGKLCFHIKELGDYTRTLPEVLRVGQMAIVEGPYGCFDFSGPQQRQIWIGGGIGITPFMARLQALAVQPDGREIDLWYSTAEPDPGFIERLTRLAEEAGIRLHVVFSERDGRLSADRLCEAVPQWKEASIWFCGPGGFGKALREGLTERGLAPANFHQELFDMR